MEVFRRKKLEVFENSMVEEFSKQFAWNVNKKLLGFHVLFLAVFYYYQIHPMIYINMVSVFIYTGSFLILKKHRVLYLKITYLEILIHMAFAVVCIGWGFGFQLYCFALIPMTFYADYLEQKITNAKKKVYHPFVVGLGITTWFCMLKIFSSLHAPIYSMNNLIVKYIFFMLNTIVTFAYILYFMSLYKDINQQSENIIREGAQLDVLTGLKNKSWLLQIEESYFEEQCKKGYAMFIAIIDIDDFKILNDTYGHQFGDKVLFRVAMQLKELEDRGIFVCRWGGEEFLVFGNGKENFHDILAVLNEVKENISRMKFFYQNKEIHVTITIGISKKTNETTFEALMERSDEKLYFGKRNGKNQIVS